MNDCIFCKIVSDVIPSHKVWEDDHYLAILDINPLCEGQTLVLPKKHLGSYLFNLDDEDYSRLYLAAKTVAKILDKSLKVSRTATAMEGLGVAHAHIKLFPLNDQKLSEGGIIHLGPKASDAKLKELASKIWEGGMK